MIVKRLTNGRLPRNDARPAAKSLSPL